MVRNLAISMNNILQIIEDKCVDAGGDKHIDPQHLDVFKEETDYLEGRLGLSPFQSILLATIIQNDNRCSISKVGGMLGMTYLRALSYSADFYKLRDQGYIRLSPDNEIKTTPAALMAIMNDKPIEKPKTEGLSTQTIFRRLAEMMKLNSRGQETDNHILEEMDLLIGANPQSGFASACQRRLYVPEIGNYELYLFFVLSYLFICRGYSSFDGEDIESYFSDEDSCEVLKCCFDEGSLGLVKVGLLVPAEQGGLLAKGSYTFKKEIEKEFFSELKRSSDLHSVNLTDSSSKAAKQLYYNAAEQRQIVHLSNLLSPDNLDSVFQTMKGKGLRTGFTCLFYGAPGTGKTETVYQLAKATGRNILQADIASLRNCYVGETEKNVRKLFADYRLACEENELTPILLFNEADAILGKRMDGAVRAVDRMENSVQNILLQEMEDFSGILIATTNLTTNLDPAFDRRFLYKIRFNKPDLEARKLIWESQFPSLTEEETTSLAKEFSFSGGQIENVVRKYTIDSLLSSEEVSYNQIRRFCLEESGYKETKKIGF